MTLAEMLLFGAAPKRFLPQAGIEAAAFSGREKDYAARERATLREPMTPLMDRKGGLLEVGLVERALEFVRRNTTGDGRSGGRRPPRGALRLSDAGRARGGGQCTGPQGLPFWRIWILNLRSMRTASRSFRPAGCRTASPPDRMRAGTRAARNQLLKDIMKDYGYLEHMGMGVPRIIVRGMKEHNGTEPEPGRGA